MKIALLTIVILMQPSMSAEKEADQLVADVAQAYERYADAAAEIKRYSTRLSFRYEFGELHEMDGPLVRAVRGELADELAAFDSERHARMAQIAASIDFPGLIETTPGGAWLATEILRLSGEGPTREAMLGVLGDLADEGGYRSEYYRQLVEGYSSSDDDDDGEDDATREPAPQAPETVARAHELASAYRQRFETWWPLVAEIGEMRGREQYVRWLLIEVMARDLEPAVRERFQNRIGSVSRPVDTANTARVLEMLEATDFDALNAASPYGADEAIGILHHSGDIAVLRRALELIEPAALAGDFSGQTYALLYDRVAVHEDRPQRYGTQGGCVAGRHDIYNVEDPETIDERRARMGLEPFDDYRASLIEMYGEDC